MIAVVMRCGCRSAVSPDKGHGAVCPRHGSTGIARTLDAPNPRFVGHGSGPLVTSRRLKAKRVNLAPSGALPRPKRMRTPDGDEQLR